MLETQRLVVNAIERGVFPGCACALGNRARGDVRIAGRYTYDDDSPEVALDTLWDLASVSKVVATTTAAMVLYDAGSFELDRPVCDVLPGFGSQGKEDIRFRNLLVHDSGLVAFRRYQKLYTEAGDVWDAISNESLTYAIGSDTIYSDLNMIVLQRALERLTGEGLGEFLLQNVWGRLGLSNTKFNPGVGNPRCAPTEGVEPWRTRLRELRAMKVTDSGAVTNPRHWIQGEVHDPTATVLGGIAGHAGLFSTAGELARFCRFMLNLGEDLIRPETIRAFTARQGPRSTRGLGWDTAPGIGGPGIGGGSALTYGHTGYTGTSVWIEPVAGKFVVLLSNRVHPTSENLSILEFRRAFHNAAFDEIESG